MATREQTRANRNNAQHSTGPRTPAGKAKSSQNALKHGLRAQATVLSNENLDEFELLVSELENQFQPQSAIEWNLLRQLADAEWRMRRVPCLEAALLAAKIHETVRYYKDQPEQLPEDDATADMVVIGDAAESDASNGDTLSKLSRYESRLSHRYFKALEQLQKLQSPRRRSAAPRNDSPAARGPAEEPGADRPAATCHENSARAPIAKGDPSPGRKDGVHTTEAPHRPAHCCRTRSRRAKRTQFPPGASTTKPVRLQRSGFSASGPGNPTTGHATPRDRPHFQPIPRRTQAFDRSRSMAPSLPGFLRRSLAAKRTRGERSRSGADPARRQTTPWRIHE